MVSWDLIVRTFLCAAGARLFRHLKTMSRTVNEILWSMSSQWRSFSGSLTDSLLFLHKISRTAAFWTFWSFKMLARLIPKRRSLMELDVFYRPYLEPDDENLIKVGTKLLIALYLVPKVVRLHQPKSPAFTDRIFSCIWVMRARMTTPKAAYIRNVWPSAWYFLHRQLQLWKKRCTMQEYQRNCDNCRWSWNWRRWYW